MKLSDRVRVLIKTVIDDLFGEGDESVPAGTPEGASRAPSDDFLAGALQEAQGHLDSLRRTLLDAQSVQIRLGQEIDQALDQASQARLAADQALEARQEEQARQCLQQARQAETLAGKLGEQRQDYSRLVSEMESALRTEQARLDELQRKRLELLDRQRGAEALEEIVQARRSLHKQVAGLQAGLEEREEQISRREDQLAVRQDLAKKG